MKLKSRMETNVDGERREDIVNRLKSKCDKFERLLNVENMEEGLPRELLGKTYGKKTERRF